MSYKIIAKRAIKNNYSEENQAGHADDDGDRDVGFCIQW